MQFAPLLLGSMNLCYEYVIPHSFEFTAQPVTGCCRIQAIERTLNTK